MRQIETDPVSGSDVDDELAAFCAAQGQALLRFAFLLTGGHGPRSEDLVQTVLARLVARGLDGIDDPLTYARRSIVNEHHSQGRHLAVQSRVHPRLAADARGWMPAAQPEDRLALLAALRILTDRERAAVVLRYYEDLPDPEIAALLRCSRPTVRSLIHRAMPKLRTRLGDTYRSGDAGGPDDRERGGRDE